VFLQYIFQLDNHLINVGWFILMVLSATVTIIRKSELNLKLMILPALVSLLISVTGVLLYFNAFVVQVRDLFTAKYFIVLGGMILGNSLRGNIVGLNSFYQNLKRNEERYLYMLAAGASLFEGILPYFKKGLAASLAPTLATMATMGIVSLPGMMTGQILGGSSPIVAVKYQIAIMIAIFVAVIMSTSIAIFMTLKFSFQENGVLKKTIYK
jgi:putative ABC transport system permease protein